jgi:hypothetical protein
MHNYIVCITIPPRLPHIPVALTHNSALHHDWKHTIINKCSVSLHNDSRPIFQHIPSTQHNNYRYTLPNINKNWIFSFKFHPLPSIGRTANYEHFPTTCNTFIQTPCTFNTSYFSQSECPAKTNTKLLSAPSYIASLFHISLLSVHIVKDYIPINCCTDCRTQHLAHMPCTAVHYSSSFSHTKNLSLGMLWRHITDNS